MTLTPRDKWMCAVLPALLTIIVAQRAYIHPVNREIEALRKQIQAQGPLAARQAALKQAEAENSQLAALMKARSTPATPAQNGHAATAHAFNRTLSLEQISKLCEAGNLTLISSSADASPKLPPTLAQAAKVLIKPGDPSSPQVWRLELRGGYIEMMEFLDRLAQAPSLVVPLNIGMQPDADETMPITWTLSVWL
jgi:hypothetical protein